MTTVPTIEEVLRHRPPMRVLILIRQASSLWQSASVSSDRIIEEALATLHVRPSDAQYKFLVNEKWPFLNLFVFALYHGAYRSASAHFPHDLPVLVVDYNRKGTTVSIAGSVRRREVNVRVAEHHNLNGWDREPPFFAD
ncbi:hypothetical protein OEA41_010624 [Lepraria neglecta]|uniref:Uncharacterized protein n=1 Tax=Lepraria neglecta TaxID=209136 RepID=A0AAD9Z057_9LECA|nr:hypothetical protein OEA41_010624 [Lepraria neglecta]